MLDVAARVSSSPRLHHSIRQPVHDKDCRQVVCQRARLFDVT